MYCQTVCHHLYSLRKSFMLWWFHAAWYRWLGGNWCCRMPVKVRYITPYVLVPSDVYNVELLIFLLKELIACLGSCCTVPNELAWHQVAKSELKLHPNMIKSTLVVIYILACLFWSIPLPARTKHTCYLWIWSGWQYDWYVITGTPRYIYVADLKPFLFKFKS